MDSLPEELVLSILNYLEPVELVRIQTLSRKLLGIGRDNSLWRSQCFEKSPSRSTRSWAEIAATQSPEGSPSASLNSTGQDLLQSLHAHPVIEDNRPSTTDSRTSTNPLSFPGSSFRSRTSAISNWDPAYVQGDTTEKVDWYSEYVARHSQLSIKWLAPDGHRGREARGMATVNVNGTCNAIAPLEDGSLCLWRLGNFDDGEVTNCATSTPGILFDSGTQHANSSKSTADRVVEFGDVSESVSVSSHLGRAYCATANVITEIDLQTLQPLSQQKFAWEITALSRENLPTCTTSVAVGTRHSLHIYDSRAPDLHNSPSDGTPEDRIAFLPNPVKQKDLIPQSRSRRSRNHHTMGIQGMAAEEPGPISVLSQSFNLFLAGRFPSILRYDQRYFPRLEDTIHSGGRLSSMSYLPYPPKGSRSSYAYGTLVACGEYGGRGSLELYSLPHEAFAGDNEHAVQRPYVYKNRQTAASAKLLSVATHGTRIVFSDADGGLKWVERDGRSLVRRWNINQYSINDHADIYRHGSRLFEASATANGNEGTDVVRKMLPVHQLWESERGFRGDSDLLIWTGERVGMVQFKDSNVDDLAASFDQQMSLSSDDDQARQRQMEHEHDGQMRRALERQAEEMYWMRRFGHGSRFPRGW
ncbi:MAG: hypothetical protein Q9227_000486 [Pyrenula ochraceoflavens]